MYCNECYSDKNRVTPLLNPYECLKNHEQYICGICGRCICIDKDSKRNVQRWNFPFKTLEIAKLYLRTADFSVKAPCGIYELENSKGRKSYRIFRDLNELKTYLDKNKDKICKTMAPLFQQKEYIEYPNTRIDKLNIIEIDNYLKQQKL